MFKVNDNFCKLSQSYLFSEVARRINAYLAEHPETEIIRMGIGDVTRPLCDAVIEAMQKAVEEQRDSKTFRGYGPEQGYAFLRDKIAQYDYQRRGINISADEIFISDGAKSDTGNFGDILSTNNTVALSDPVYPVYLDTNVMAGRAGNKSATGAWDKVVFLPCNSENGFIPSLPESHVDMIYLCYPNNPTGTTLTRVQLKVWVDYARANGSLILFDSAYEAFITDDDVPHSIYEIPGAEEVAVEFRSFSKTAGFTGVRCAYTVVPKALKGEDSDGNKVELNQLWNRRQCTKFNGASYVSQRAAEAIYSAEGRRQVEETIAFYLENARLLREGLSACGLKVFGGVNAPYIWVKTPEGYDSWQFFGVLLDKCHIACTPGVGFGLAGEGYIRLTAFSSRENTLKAVEKLKNLKY
jgi:LL-diaminopimelate aminotransferase